MGELRTTTSSNSGGGGGDGQLGTTLPGAVAYGTIWCLVRLVKGMVVAVALAGWAGYKWCSGARWTYRPRRRRLTRPARALLQNLVTAVVVGLALVPAATATVLVATVVTLLTAAVWHRHRHFRPQPWQRQPLQAPIRVKAHVDTPIRRQP